MSKHTPTPWHVVKMYGWGDSLCISRRSQADLDGVAGEGPIAVMSRGASHWETPFPVEANAAFIVRAVNAHDALVEALKGAGRLLHSEGYSDRHPVAAKIAKALRAAGVEP